MKMPVRFELVLDRPVFRRVSQDRLAAASGNGGGTISTVSSAVSSSGCACRGTSGSMSLTGAACVPVLLTDRGAVGAAGTAGRAAAASACGATDSCAVCDSSGVASGSFEPLNRLKKLNMFWRGESERRCAQPVGPGGSGRQRDNAGCKALEGAYFIRHV